MNDLPCVINVDIDIIVKKWFLCTKKYFKQTRLDIVTQTNKSKIWPFPFVLNKQFQNNTADEGSFVTTKKGVKYFAGKSSDKMVRLSVNTMQVFFIIIILI